MNKLFVTLLLLFSTWAFAQTRTAPSNQTESGNTKSTAVQSVEGCLTGADDGIEGTFKLVEASGRSYLLAGNPSVLQNNVGHRVQLWGRAHVAGGGETVSTEGLQGTFGVDKVQTLATTCRMIPTVGDD